MKDHPVKIFLPNNAQSILLISVSVCLQMVTMRTSVLDLKDFSINALLSHSNWLTQLHLTSGSTEHLVSFQIQLFSWRLREFKLLCPSFIKQIFLLCKTLLQKIPYVSLPRKQRFCYVVKQKLYKLNKDLTIWNNVRGHSNQSHDA